ncbi:MAG: 3-hydroxyacyl-CoA dehydrogenase/enoyl-CoA hydratase family protein [Acidimicrobiia bacterium]|nr:3-hydroxyacyl-CoA dehydrogenase/enoyl-CoA hydratase family protein [Acidimicrobiia bacterium]
MTKRIERVAVVGAGVMGAAIAAHFVNAHFAVDLLDIVPEDLTPEEKSRGLTLSHPAVRNRIVARGLEAAKRNKPPAFFLPKWFDRVRQGNLEDHFERLAEADWIVEAVAENLDIKKSLLKRIESVRRPDAIVSTNTSGIPIQSLASERSTDFRRHWVGTHFFNPPRYMRLLEVIPGAETRPWVVATVSEIGDRRLGKGIVVCKDTPNFIANRIGTFGLQHVLLLLEQDGYSLDEVDQLTGPAIGRPKSATFRTLDIVGLDTFAHVTQNIYRNAPNDEQRELFRVPAFVEVMLTKRFLGDKSGQGFYKKMGKDEILALNLASMEYGPRKKGRFPSLDMAKSIAGLDERLRLLTAATDRAGVFLWKTLSATLVYAANRVPEIADDIVSVDNAMKWGFNWELGPFETWDALGVASVAQRLEREGRPVPKLAEEVLATRSQTFYAQREGQTTYFDLQANQYREVAVPDGVLFLDRLREQGRTIKKNAGASLIDLGDGVAAVEFHSKMNSIGGDTLQMIHEGLKVARENFRGLVIGNQGQNFSVGANLMLILLEAQEQNWEEIDEMVRTFQRATMAIKYAPVPVVVAPFGMTLGGGCEICLHASRRQVFAETYMGLVESGVGLIPAGGGTKEMLVRAVERAGKDPENDLFPHLSQAFETIALGKVSGSADDARSLGFLRRGDGISRQRDRLIADAKTRVLQLASSDYQKPEAAKVTALGSRGLATLKIGMHQMKQGGFISDHDFAIGCKLACVLCGGDCNRVQEVSEEAILDLEREAFLSLCGERKTLERIQHMLQKRKPLRN